MYTHNIHFIIITNYSIDILNFLFILYQYNYTFRNTFKNNFRNDFQIGI